MKNDHITGPIYPIPSSNSRNNDRKQNIVTAHSPHRGIYGRTLSL